MSETIASISVIIPTHDRTDLLARTLESVANQTLAPVEIIVVDDLNTPATRALVESFNASSRLDVQYIDGSGLPKKSAGASRNLGAASARSSLFAFLDDDDYWAPNYLERCVEKHESTGAELVLTWSHKVIDGQLSVGMTPTAESFRTVHPGMTGSNMFISKAAFDRVSGFDPNMWVLNDVDLFIRLRDAGTSMDVVSSRLVFHEGRGAGHLSSRSERRALGLEEFLAKHEADLSVAGRRSVVRRIHRARTGPDHRIPVRVLHTVALLFYTRPSGFYGTIKRRVLFQKRMH